MYFSKIMTLCDLKICFWMLILSWCVVAQDNGDSMEDKARRFQEMLRHDGVKRTVDITEKNYNTLVRKKDIVVALFTVDQSAATGSSAQDRQLLEVVAQVFSGKVLCAIGNMITSPQLMQKADVKYSGVIKIYNHGKPSLFYGQRSPDVVVPYVSKLFEPSVMTIDSKTEKKRFDSQELPKIIAYVPKDSQEWKILKEVALHYQPMIPFYSVSDAKLAKSLHLRKTKSLQFVKPFERAISIPSKLKWNEQDLCQFIDENKKEVLKRLRLENIHEVWAVDGRAYIVPAFAAPSTQAGKRFLALCKSLAKQFKDNGNVSFIWIDPDSFPMMTTYWKETFNVDPSQPTLGAVDVSTQSAAWLAVGNVEDQAVAKRMKQWIVDLLAGDIQLLPIKTTSADGENASSQSSSSAEGGNGREEL